MSVLCILLMSVFLALLEAVPTLSALDLPPLAESHFRSVLGTGSSKMLPPLLRQALRDELRSGQEERLSLLLPLVHSIFDALVNFHEAEVGVPTHACEFLLLERQLLQLWGNYQASSFVNSILDALSSSRGGPPDMTRLHSWFEEVKSRILSLSVYGTVQLAFKEYLSTPYALARFPDDGPQGASIEPVHGRGWLRDGVRWCSSSVPCLPSCAPAVPQRHPTQVVIPRVECARPVDLWLGPRILRGLGSLLALRQDRGGQGVEPLDAVERMLWTSFEEIPGALSHDSYFNLKDQSYRELLLRVRNFLQGLLAVLPSSSASLKVEFCLSTVKFLLSHHPGERRASPPLGASGPSAPTLQSSLGEGQKRKSLPALEVDGSLLSTFAYLAVKLLTLKRRDLRRLEGDAPEVASPGLNEEISTLQRIRTLSEEILEAQRLLSSAAGSVPFGELRLTHLSLIRAFLELRILLSSSLWSSPVYSAFASRHGLDARQGKLSFFSGFGRWVGQESPGRAEELAARLEEDGVELVEVRRRLEEERETEEGSASEDVGETWELDTSFP